MSDPRSTATTPSSAADRDEDSSDSDDEASLPSDTTIPLGFLSMLLRGTRRDTTSHAALIASLVEQGCLKSDDIRHAVELLPRDQFVPKECADEAFVDSPIRTPLNFNISAPHIQMVCLEKLQIQPGMSCLDIGSGSGIMTAYMAALAGPAGAAHGLEIRQDIIDFALSNIARLRDVPVDLSKVTFECRNCFLPDPLGRQWDRIHAAANCPSTTYLDLLTAQLKPNGRLITPSGDHLVLVTKNHAGEPTTHKLMAVRYSDLILPSADEVRLAQIAVEQRRASTVAVPAPELVATLASFIENDEMSDVTFVLHDPDSSEPRRFPAHRFICAARSPFMRSLLYGQMKESRSGEVDIGGETSPETFRFILRYIYTEDSSGLHGENAIDILRAAIFFGLARLTAVAEAYLVSGLDVGNVCQLLNVADRCAAAQLRAAAREYVLSNYQTVVATPGFAELDRGLLVDITSAAVARLSRATAAKSP